MAGCVISGVTSSSKWMKKMGREVIHDGRIFHSCPNSGHHHVLLWMTKRLKWVKAVSTEVIYDGRNFHRPSNSGCLRGYSQFTRYCSVNDFAENALLCFHQCKVGDGSVARCLSSLIDEERVLLSGCCSLLMYNHGEGSYTRERRQAASSHGAYLYAQDQSNLKEAVADLMDRVNRGVAINSYGYTQILQWCSKQKDFESARQVQDCIKKSQIGQDLYVASVLLKCYIGCGRLETALEIFNNLVKKDTVIWNVMIGGCAELGQAERAFGVYKQMQNEGWVPDAVTYLSVLKACASPTALERGKEIHANIIRDGFQADVRIGTTLVLMYAKCGSIEDARVVFGRMERRNVISWNVLIGGLAEHGLGHEAFSWFLQMQKEGFTPTVITYLNILNPCSSEGALEWVKEVHAHAVKAGLDSDVRLGNALVQMYARSGSIESSKAVFDKIKRRDVVSWNMIIGALAEHGLGHEAFSFFLQMQREKFTPDVITFLNILNPCSSTGSMDWVKEVNAYARKACLDVDVRVGTALVQMYAKTGSIEDAKAVFARIEKLNVISWNVLIGGMAEHGLGHEAFSWFLQMQREGFTPTVITYLNILNPSSSKGALEWVKEVHAHAVKAGLDSDVRLGNALVQMYAKTGNIADAREVFDKMPIRDVISWAVMIGGLAQHGHGQEALLLFGKMKSDGVKSDVSVLVAAMTACSHAGLVEEGRLLFVNMKRDHGIEPTLEHYNCMVDILGRAGHLEDSKLFILNMPIKPNKVTWKAFLAACTIFRNIVLAELAAKECQELEPTDSAAYVLLSNVYAAGGHWDQVSMTRKMMQDRGVRKDPGRCWIEVGKKIHHFVVGDTSHPESSDIYAMLSCLSKRLKAEGYIADTRLVLRNINDEDKENALTFHSEKLAIAYGLMHVPPEEPIRIYKNLRICSDCHLVSKLISKVTGREIVARDANRFHLFKDGLCSCGDFW